MHRIRIWCWGCYLLSAGIVTMEMDWITLAMGKVTIAIPRVSLSPWLPVRRNMDHTIQWIFQKEITGYLGYTDTSWMHLSISGTTPAMIKEVYIVVTPS
jgi:hypothetical protein